MNSTPMVDGQSDVKTHGEEDEEQHTAAHTEMSTATKAREDQPMQ
jgi:hypothetical protein